MPKHLDVINGERDADIRELLEAAFEADLEALKRDVAVSEELLRKDREEEQQSGKRA